MINKDSSVSSNKILISNKSKLINGSGSKIWERNHGLEPTRGDENHSDEFLLNTEVQFI